MQQQLSPTACTILRSSSFVVTSTETQRFVFLRSIVDSRSRAALFLCRLTRSPYVRETTDLVEEDMMVTRGL